MTERLLVELARRANRRGLVVARGTSLEARLALQPSQIEQGLAELARRGAVRILSPLPYLTLVLTGESWSGKRDVPIENPVNAGTSASRGYSYGSQEPLIDQSNAMALENEGAEEGEELLAEILDTLGESDPGPFRGVLRHYSRPKIHAALARVRATPPERLRKTRTALFRFLLARSK